MGMSFLQNVHWFQLEAATNIFNHKYRRMQPYRGYLDQEFRDFVGISQKQYLNYTDNWKLMVSPLTAKKIELLANNSPHLDALLKIAELQSTPE